jgi:hypothetical protein
MSKLRCQISISLDGFVADVRAGVMGRNMFGPVGGIHVCGGNIGTIRRRSDDPATGEGSWFVSGWDSLEGGTPQGAQQLVAEDGGCRGTHMRKSINATYLTLDDTSIGGRNV